MLPEEVLTFLEDNQTSGILRHFTVKRLGSLTRLPAEGALSRFAKSVGGTDFREPWPL